jgi:hydroxymethylbilane synthase
MHLRIGSRRSALALAQTESFVHLLVANCPDVRVQILPIVTAADSQPETPLPQLGTKDLFTAELAQALLDGQIDLAVHSAKDLPAAMDDGFAIVAVPVREDPRDALVSSAGGLADLAAGATVGTGSPRRKAQLQANLQRYLQDQPALAEAADEVEARMAVTKEALERGKW